MFPFTNRTSNRHVGDADEGEGVTPFDRLCCCAMSSATCANCGAHLSGPFCHRCGQHESANHPATLGHLLHEGAHELLHVDGKVFRTAKALFLEPGRLTAE